MPRTNNSCEGYNSRLSRRVVISHPNIYELIKVLKIEHANKAAFLMQIDAGHCPQKKRKLDQDIDDHLEKIGLSYMLCDIDLPRYLLSCGQTVRGNFIL